MGKLGVEKNIPKVNFLEYTGIFSAEEKFGKTAFASLYPNSIICAFEKGYKAQVVNKRDINIWDDFVDFIDLLEENREEIGKDVQSIIIDTAEESYLLVAPYVCRKQGIKDKTRYNDIKDIPYGQGWQYVDTEYKAQIKRIIDMGFCILYLTHVTIKNVKPKNGEAYDVYKSTMPDRCANIIYPACDYIIFGERKNVKINETDSILKRALVIKGNNDKMSGTRFYLDEDIIFDTEEEAMEKLQEQFKKSIIKTLEKNGIKTDINKLAKEQEIQKDKQVKKYIEDKKTSPEAIMQQIKKTCKEKAKAGVANSEINAIIGNMKYETIEIAQEVLDKITRL